ncbi:hypothetical protein ACT3TI_13630 [Psychrobacter sp. AOP22-C1-22]|uniref:hypothetical protein n=1 Tax=unclassified Psychrobacter TaxID=196806 RepID=UPI001787C373|nr:MULTISPECIES: hypothetical protein [unclassified Psychrobacter]MBE0407867.1 hypothetical protein [Psychrobacter sp. FME6]MBE0445478.1 hypothetical protein [Psychrobacter sp. FME5]MDN5802749.1 hypothetical protein [Psychrobacter sp.]MDN5898191.1 hypothetical protein [Psychrobacter sp.]
MDNSKSPLPEAMDHIEGDTNLNDNSQEIDLDNPMLHTIDNDDVIDNSAGFDNSEVGTDATQGLTPMHRQNTDEARVDEVLVDDNLDDSDYPNIVDIADREAAEHTNNDDL